MSAVGKKSLYLLRTHRHLYWILLYTLFYLICFSVLERAGHLHYHVIHTWLDDQIPFCEYFVIPYFLWFGFNIGVVAWFLFMADKSEYYRLIAVMMTGMTVFLAVSLIYPNRLDIRPDYVDTSNIFGMLVAYLYKSDTPTNVLPSIHVFNTMILCYAINGNRYLRKRPAIIIGANALGTLIVLSTMFLKQHSVIDVSLGIVMSVIVQMLGERIFVTNLENRFSEEAGDVSYKRSSRREMS